MRVGLFGGSFDPIHHGHLAVASCARAQADLSEVLFVPTRISPLKLGLPPVPDLDRWTMVVLATLSEPAYRAVRWDLEREGPSYTVETLRIARRELGESAELFWIIGADNLVSLPRWHDVAGIVAQAKLLVIPREDLHGQELVQAKLALPEALHARIELLEMEPVRVSSTEVRASLQAGRPVEGLVPGLTMAYIERYNLFRPVES
jgi:nicotinate-nucleotide adenylyltransferase